MGQIGCVHTSSAAMGEAHCKLQQHSHMDTKKWLQLWKPCHDPDRVYQTNSVATTHCVTVVAKGCSGMCWIRTSTQRPARACGVTTPSPKVGFAMRCHITYTAPCQGTTHCTCTRLYTNSNSLSRQAQGDANTLPTPHQDAREEER